MAEYYTEDEQIKFLGYSKGNNELHHLKFEFVDTTMRLSSEFPHKMAYLKDN
jgi:hypothetical protein